MKKKETQMQRGALSRVSFYRNKKEPYGALFLLNKTNRLVPRANSKTHSTKLIIKKVFNKSDIRYISYKNYFKFVAYNGQLVQIIIL